MHFSTLITTAVVTMACTTGLVQAAPIQARGQNALYGITYTAKNSDGSCQTTDEVLQYVKDFSNNGIKHIRTYSQECDQLGNILNAISSVDSSMKVTAAVWLDGSSGDDEEINNLLSALKANSKNIKLIDGITVGNEVIFSGSLSSSALVSKIKQVKSATSSYNIPVGTVDTPNTFPSDVIAASDVIGVNIHPYFGGVDISQAGSNMKQQLNTFKSKAQGKSVFVAETGWPSAGNTNGASVPSVSNVQSYVNQLRSMSDIEYYYFEALDSNWKPAGNDGVETHFGLYNSNGKSKVSF
ncbi:glycoside hydrolase superfamily [Halteromyces radiatus]|uniref:glycoside hydrolase superfamily n=1 Tax=Halteromyces radiatus TaxID=101107 RepID=UPI00221FF9D0|nr:glycoside hydrolase superfamily [Halteromyces radiatus]KAI8096404.1 glycoside hydrolase superfamily [Halteromyces radiatus]